MREKEGDKERERERKRQREMGTTERERGDTDRYSRCVYACGLLMYHKDND